MKYNIIFNKGYCSICHDDLESWHRHDFSRCSCGKSAIDGGTDYIKITGSAVSTAISTDDPFEVVRKYMYRGGYGATGQGPFRYTRLCKMDDSYLTALLDYKECPDWQRKLVEMEIEYRKQNKT